MKFKITNFTKVVLVILCFSVSILGFMIKLPASFRYIDKELHSLFYFLAAAFLNILFVNRSLWKHMLVFLLLFLFGVSIEYAQEYSNKFMHVRIHGRFDPEDVKSNLRGLVAFSGLWLLYLIITLAFAGGKEVKATDTAV